MRSDSRLRLCSFWTACAIVLSGCAGLPSLEGRTTSTTLQDTGGTRLGRAVLPLALAHTGQSGLVLLVDGRDAFAARLRLADAAERSLDVQSYIWHGDLTGTLLFDAMRRAADRGVRVRLLLDDNSTADLTDVLAAMATHPNIEVRLFNPFASRRWRPLAYVSEFARLNRRMHNKSFTADNQATIVGGRNIGDAYFAAGPNVLFVDLDVLAIGPVVGEVSQDFDRYWASDSSYPASRLLPGTGASALHVLADAADSLARSEPAVAYSAEVAKQPFVTQVAERRLPFEWAVTHLVSDAPAKARGQSSESELLWTKLRRVMQTPTRELAVVSPYFVPEGAGVAFLADLAGKGVKVTVITNSLEATDVPAVHSGYAKWRQSLLKAGISLLEMKRGANVVSESGLAPGSSSGSSLHSKTFSVDRHQVFIGSFNFDPRSSRLNTELGFVIDSPAMAGAIADAIDGPLAARAYRLRLTDSGAIQWVEQVAGERVVHDVEPGTTIWQRIGITVLSLLPIEWLL